MNILDRKVNIMSNTNLERESIGYFFIIEASVGNARKYISSSFPRIYQYTLKIKKAHRFQTEELALRFIDGFNDYGKYPIANPVVKKVRREFIVEEV